MAGNRRDPAHRAVIFGAIIGGVPLARVNEWLAAVGARPPLPVSSYESIRKHYIPYFNRAPGRLGQAIEHPPTWSQLKEAGERDLPIGVPPDGTPVEDDDD
jgi:hypothetical protein